MEEEREPSLKKTKAAKDDIDGPGVVYIGRIPHGFYEHEMRAYFAQFGAITRLRLSRNRTTGASKHYAFIEFASASVAKIVANTMNNYLMFGHILKCKLVPDDQVHEKMWIGANKRFKPVPWSRIEGRKLATGMDREGWEKRVETEKKRREAKSEAMKRIGYEFNVGGLKGVEDVLVRKEKTNIEDQEATSITIEEKETVVINAVSEGNILAISERITTKKSSTDLRVTPTEEKLADKASDPNQVVPPIAKRSKASESTAIDTLAPALQKSKDVGPSIGDEVTHPIKQAKNSKKRKTYYEATPLKTTVISVSETTTNTLTPALQKLKDVEPSTRDEVNPLAKKAKKSKKRTIEEEATPLAEKAKKTKKKKVNHQVEESARKAKKVKGTS